VAVIGGDVVSGIWSPARNLRGSGHQPLAEPVQPLGLRRTIIATAV
jgi:hypothetical protein